MPLQKLGHIKDTESDSSFFGGVLKTFILKKRSHFYKMGGQMSS